MIDHVNRKVQPSSTLMEKWGEGERETVTGRNRDRETEIVTHMQTWESEEGRRRRRETTKQEEGVVEGRNRDRDTQTERGERESEIRETER